MFDATGPGPGPAALTPQPDPSVTTTNTATSNAGPAETQGAQSMGWLNSSLTDGAVNGNVNVPDMGFDGMGEMDLIDFAAGIGVPVAGAPSTYESGMRYVMSSEPWLSDMMEGMPGSGGYFQF
jgi:hypothetical protein